MKVSPCVLLALLALQAVSSTSLAQAAAPCRLTSHYRIIALPLRPARINNSGEVAGSTPGASGEDQQAATWSKRSGLRELSIPAGFSSLQPLGLNEAGDIVGQVTSSGGAASERAQAFVCSHGKFKLLSEASSKAKAINNAGQIAGEQTPNGPVLWGANKTRPLGGCCGGRVFALNDRGEVAGELNDRQGRYSAFLWDAKRGMQIVAPPGARSSSALAINNSGHALIQAFSPNQIFLRENGKLTPVELSPEFASQPLALNDCDVMVGEYGASSDYYHAFVWDKKNGFRDLNKLVDKAEGWNLESAVDINDRGEIVGTGDHGNEGDAGFLLIPDPTAITTKGTKILEGNR